MQRPIITAGPGIDPVGAALARTAGVVDFATLESLVPETGAKVRATFQRLLPPDRAKLPDFSNT